MKEPVAHDHTIPDRFYDYHKRTVK